MILHTGGPQVIGINTGILISGPGALVSWWLGSGTISSANVLEHVELPEIAQIYAGASVSGGNPWTIATRTIWQGSALGATYLLDSQSGRVVCGWSNLTQRGVFTTDSGWANIDLFTLVDAVYYWVSDGSSIQLYRDNSAIGAAVTSNEGIGGTTRWRSVNSGASNTW